MNTAHQLGSTLGIAILVAVAATAGDASTEVARLAGRVGAALTGSAGLLALALVVVLAFILPKELAARRAHRAEADESLAAEGADA